DAGYCVNTVELDEKIFKNIANVLRKGGKMSEAIEQGEGKPSEQNVIRKTTANAAGAAGPGSPSSHRMAIEEKPWLPDAWDKETDVVIIGYGATGAVTAITVSEAGGRAIVIEKAPETGGTSAVSTGGMRYTNDARQAAIYVKNIGLGTIDEETAEVFAEEWVDLKPWMERHGIKLVKPISYTKPFQNMGAPDMEMMFVESFEGYPLGCGRDLFAFLDDLVKRRGVEVMLNTPAKRLVQHPATKEIMGVIAESGGKKIAIKAKKAVVMTCGGFSANREMIGTYITHAPVEIHPTGTPYSTGDGIKMAIDVGADLWHMNGIEYSTHAFKADEFPSAFWLQPKGQSWIHVNRSGRRFHGESGLNYGHTKKFVHIFDFIETPSWTTADWPNSPWYIIFDEKVKKAGPICLTERLSGASPFITYNSARELYAWSSDNQAEIDNHWIKNGAGVAELADQINVDPTGLQETITRYNGYCASGLDGDFKRDPESLVSIDTPPFYAIECCMGIINTQGAPEEMQRVRYSVHMTGRPSPGFTVVENSAPYGRFFTPAE
ncbi:FAD-dependent oxidoreductase, partial [Thermodesulfobacteriota bacterium]